MAILSLLLDKPHEALHFHIVILSQVGRYLLHVILFVVQSDGWVEQSGRAGQCSGIICCCKSVGGSV